MLEKTNLSIFDTSKVIPKENSFINAFDILNTEKNEKMLNIFKNFTINDVDNLSIFGHYTVKENGWWDQISYEVYGSPFYWWILALFNKVENPFESLYPRKKHFNSKKRISQYYCKFIKTSKSTLICLKK